MTEQLPGWFSPSLNPVAFARLPALPGGFAGARAGDWLSSMGIARRMAERGLADGLPPVADGFTAAAIIPAAAYPVALDAMLDGSADARALADDLGVALAALIATLVLAPEHARSARPEWPPEHWARWGRARRLALGGGIVRGRLGARMLEVAQLRLAAFGVPQVEAWIADEPDALVLRGAAASLPDGRGVLVDAGHTSIKPALADIAGGRLVILQRRAPIATASVLQVYRGAALADRLAEIAVDAAGTEPIIAAGFAIAAFTDGLGQPIGGPGAYPSLAEVALVPHLEARLAERLGRRLGVRVAGDGDAAGAAVRGHADAAIVLGTALASGLNV